MSSSLLRFEVSRPTSSSSYKNLVSSRIFGLATFSLSWASNTPHHINTKRKQKLCVKGSAQEIPQQLEEDSKFVPLDPEDPLFGPPVSFFHSFNHCRLFKSVIIDNTLEHIFFCRFCCCLDFKFMKHRR